MATRKRTDFIVIHVSATKPSWKGGAKEIDAMHKARGWAGIGYHYVIKPDGTLEKGRAPNAVGAHVAGFNSISLGICLVGGLDAAGNPADTRTPAQETALISLLTSLTKTYPNARICGHRDLSPDRDGDGIIEPFEHLKACPCFDVIPWAKKNNLPAADIKGIWDKYPPDPTNSPHDVSFEPSGPDARNAYLQRLLQRAGYEFGAIDGIVGPKTRAALKRFQAASALKQTGTFDTPTVARLRQMFEGPLKVAGENAVWEDTLARARVEIDHDYSVPDPDWDEQWDELTSNKPSAPPTSTPQPSGFFAWLAHFFSSLFGRR